MRKSFDFLGSYWRNLQVIGNYTRTFSEVEVTLTDLGTYKRKRPLVDQSPYLINFGLFFTEPVLESSVTIMYNKIGSRIRTVGKGYYGDICEEPRDVVDLTLKQMFGGIEWKFSVKNLLGRDIVSTEKFANNEPQEVLRLRVGRTLSMQMSLSL
jgi:hypothetical protein